MLNASLSSLYRCATYLSAAFLVLCRIHVSWGKYILLAGTPRSLHLILGVTLQVQQGSGGPPTSGLQGVGVPVNQQGMFMAQSVTGRAAGFPVGGMGNSALQGPLAFLEKTTSNIGMPERRS